MIGANVIAARQSHHAVGDDGQRNSRVACNGFDVALVVEQVPTVCGKPLRECNGLDLLMSIEAHKIVAAHFGALSSAAQTLADEQRAEASG
jgi:hypothetical protein